MTPIETLAERLRTAHRVTVLTGAGVSAASGVPTFRGAGGLWRNFTATDLATPEAFARDPHTVWEWYDWRRQQIARCEPNPAHRVLAAWTQAREGWRVVTQNVDDLHLRAGTKALVRLHGSIFELRCWNGCPGAPHGWRDERVPLPKLPPTCPRCGGLARPGVVWFGENLDPAAVAAAEALTSCDVLISAGTSALVHPAAGLITTARARGAFTAEINIETTDATGAVEVAVRAPVEQVLAELDALL
ncbi:MAG: NAD-dependent deacetylase [Vicinamibacterales bacterium]